MVSDPNGAGFKGWFTAATGGSAVTPSNLSAPSGITTYYAQFGSSTHTVTITTPSNGTLTVTDGSTPVSNGDAVAHGSTLTLTAMPATGYYFSSWTNDAAASVTVNSDVTLGATFAPSTYQLTYEGLNGASNTNPATYTIETATFTLANPGTRAGYTFSGWTCGGDAIMQIALGSTGDKTITANWTLDVTNYNLTFRAGANGSVSGSAASAAIAAGTTHSIAENTAISLTATANTFYAFKEWQNTSTHAKVSEENPYNFSLSGATDLTAVFEIANPLVLIDNEGAAYYTAYDALDGTENVNVRINRSISANMWSTICLPFDVDMEEAGNEVYDGKFYRFMGATGDYTGIDLHFTPAGYVDANTPYLFRPDADVTRLDFANVTLKAREENSTGSIGNVTFRGTIAPQTLNDVEGHTILGLYNNKIYYPNTSSGTYIRAFRGYFTVDGAPAGVQPRVRIVVQDNHATPIEVTELNDGKTGAEVRKYVENGVMVIEKNGLRYNVTGQEMK